MCGRALHSIDLYKRRHIGFPVNSMFTTVDQKILYTAVLFGRVLNLLLMFDIFLSILIEH